MAVKRSFKDMLPPLAAVPEPTTTPALPEPEASAAAVQSKAAQVAAPAQATTQDVAAAVGEEEAPAVSVRPHYTQLVRKELRVFQDQAVDLKILTMTINNSKLGMGERITDNTLVRVAIDLLLERKADLSGTTESELRESLNLPPRY